MGNVHAFQSPDDWTASRRARASMGEDLRALAAEHRLAQLAEELDAIGERVGDALPYSAWTLSVAVRDYLEHVRPRQ